MSLFRETSFFRKKNPTLPNFNLSIINGCVISIIDSLSRHITDSSVSEIYSADLISKEGFSYGFEVIFWEIGKSSTLYRILKIQIHDDIATVSSGFSDLFKFQDMSSLISHLEKLKEPSSDLNTRVSNLMTFIISIAVINMKCNEAK